MFKNLFKKNGGLKTEIVPEIVVNNGSADEKEAYTKLKDNVLYFSDNGKNKVFQVESSVSGEGKSAAVANLAVALAGNGKKVAVADLDFRAQKQYEIFKTLNAYGIVEYVSGECSYSQLIKETEYGVDVINRGKVASNASVVFMSDTFKSLIEKLKEEYDFVLFDCPAVLEASDYIHITKFSDGVIFVVSKDVVRRSQVKEAVAALKKSGANVMGTVVTETSKRGFGKTGF